MTSIYKDLVRPLVFRADSEKIHEFGLKSLRVALGSGIAQRVAGKRFKAPGGLESEVFGLKFENPVGIAAGFDKNGVAVDQLAALGFGFVEIGTVTLLPQPGNPKPRMFRLPRDGALINRLGFNNAGAEAVVRNLERAARHCVIGVNIGRNKNVPNEEAVENYTACLESVYGVADYITVNVSSPNTPELRRLQESEKLDRLLAAIFAKRSDLKGESEPGKPILIKIAPDLSDEALDQLIEISESHGVDGMIATNTTVQRRELETPGEIVRRIGEGGLSGKPIRARSTEVIKHVYRKTGGRLPIIGVGGVFDATDAFEKIAAGASLVQGYTGFVYAGPSYAHDINAGLKSILDKKGFASLRDAVGSAS